VLCPRSVESSRQQGEFRLGEFLSPPDQAHGDKDIGKIEYDTAAMMAAEKVRIPQGGTVRATCSESAARMNCPPFPRWASS
jgi:hypothetical protein